MKNRNHRAAQEGTSLTRNLMLGQWEPQGPALNNDSDWIGFRCAQSIQPHSEQN